MINLRRISLLKSSLFSARIEGNPLTIKDFPEADDRDIHVIEITNINRAYSLFNDKNIEIMDIPFIQKLHAIVMESISPDAGLFRTEESAIFNAAGVAVYLSPRPQDIRQLLQELCEKTNAAGFSAPIVSAVAHIWFEKIHPFPDGNGRVGRLLVSGILKKGGYDFAGIVPFEQYLDEHREEYYDALLPDKQNITGFIEFFLGVLLSQARLSLEEITHPKPQAQSTLLPRRQEIIHIISDHVMVSFDFIRRRFQKIPVSTIHYDLLDLQKKGFIEKMGSTRGALYRKKE